MQIAIRVKPSFDAVADDGTPFCARQVTAALTQHDSSCRHHACNDYTRAAPHCKAALGCNLQQLHATSRTAPIQQQSCTAPIQQSKHRTAFIVMVPRVPQHLLNAALKKLTLLLAAATLINEAKRKKNAPLKLLPDRTFVATRAREELKTVYFLRHGESQWNEAQANRNPVKMFGKFDHALTAEGLEQADRLARRIAKTPSVEGGAARVRALHDHLLLAVNKSITDVPRGVARSSLLESVRERSDISPSLQGALLSCWRF